MVWLIMLMIIIFIATYIYFFNLDLLFLLLFVDHFDISLITCMFIVVLRKTNYMYQN